VPSALFSRHGVVEPILDCVEAYLFVRGPPRVLMLKRSPARGGFWQSVTGRVETWDSSFPAAALREIREETGFSRARAVIDLDWSFQFPSPSSGLPLRAHALAVELPECRSPRLSDEHVEFRWCGLGDALALMHWPDNREALRRTIARAGL
jgi:lipoyl(octanoyl) transferase